MNGYGVSSGANRTSASSRPCATTATRVTRFAASTNGPTSPAMSKISSVLGKMASALECSDCPARVSTMRAERPRRAHSFARRRPTGPAPTIRTSKSVGPDGISGSRSGRQRFATAIVILNPSGSVREMSRTPQG